MACVRDVDLTRTPRARRTLSDLFNSFRLPPMPSSRWKRAVVASKLTAVVKAAPAEASSSAETEEKVKSAARTWIDGRWTRGKLITDEAFATLIAASPHVGLLQTSLPTAFAADRDLLDLVSTLVASHVASQRIRESSDAAFASMLTELDSAFADDPESRHTARTIAERASTRMAQPCQAKIISYVAGLAPNPA